MELGVRIVGLVLRLLNILMAPLAWFKRRRPVVIPMDPLLMRSAAQLARGIRLGELTSEEVIRKYIHRVQQVNRYLNAVVDERFQAAIQDAKVADILLEEARRNGTVEKIAEEKPLLGVPFTVKESCSLAGLSNSVGMLENAGSRATTDGAAVTLMKNAGAIPLLVSNTPELCLGWETTNMLRGATNNPYDVNKTPGGSSGGEAALLASGASPLSLSSDIAGSIRVPAAFCGLFALKPTPGIIPIEGHVPTLLDPQFREYLCVGPMTRTSEDLELAMKVLASDRCKELGIGEEVDMTKLKVYHQLEATKSLAAMPVESCIKEAIKRSADYLNTECGCTLMQETFPEFEDAVDIAVSMFFSMTDIPNMLQDPFNPKITKKLLPEMLKSPFGGCNRTFQSLCFCLIQQTQLFIPDSKRPALRKKAADLKAKLISALSSDGVLLYPSFSGRAFPHGGVVPRSSGVVYCMLFNVLGLSAAVVPAGAHRGLPVTVQVVAAPNQDRLCLAVAKQLEKCFGGWQPPCL